MTLKNIIAKRKDSLYIEYNIIKELGEGAYGKVELAERLNDGNEVALKIFELSGPEPEIKFFREEIEIEVELLKMLSQPRCNPYIVCYFDNFINYHNPNQYIIVMEYINGKNINKTTYDVWEIIKNKCKVNRKNKKAILHKFLLLSLRDLLRGLSYIHSKGVVHADIKPDNIMFRKIPNEKCDNYEYQPVLVDFGISCNQNIKDNCFGGEYLEGTPIFYDPEYIKKKYKSEAEKVPSNDLWSTGLIFLNLINKLNLRRIFSRPFRDMDEILKFVSEWTTKLPETKTDNELLKQTVDKMLSKDRFTTPASELLKDIESEPKYRNAKNIIGKC